MYGQGILIEGFTTGGEDLGFLTAKGFADTMALYETYKDILYFKNYRNTLFQIVPAANFELNDELRKLREMYNEENANMKILAARSASEAEQFELGIKAYLLFKAVKRESRFVSEIWSSSNMLIQIRTFRGRSNPPAEQTEPF